MNNIILKIKQKKELSDIPDELIEDVLKNYLKKHNIKIPSSRKSQKIIIKEVRAELRKYTGQYQISSRKRIALLNQNKITQLLKTHTSTRERLPYYSKLIRIIKELNPKSILDLGCGLNPIAIINKINNKAIIYYAYDIKQDELELINNFFRKNKIKGKTILADIRKITKFPKTDLCLILKTLDIIEPNSKGHKIANQIIRQIIRNLQCKFIIISFATKTLSGKIMRMQRRIWLEKILDKLSYKFKTIRTKNEIFYIINKIK